MTVHDVLHELLHQRTFCDAQLSSLHARGGGRRRILQIREYCGDAVPGILRPGHADANMPYNSRPTITNTTVLSLISLIRLTALLNNINRPNSNKYYYYVDDDNLNKLIVTHTNPKTQRLQLI